MAPGGIDSAFSMPSLMSGNFLISAKPTAVIFVSWPRGAAKSMRSSVSCELWEVLGDVGKVAVVRRERRVVEGETFYVGQIAQRQHGVAQSVGMVAIEIAQAHAAAERE